MFNVPDNASFCKQASKASKELQMELTKRCILLNRIDENSIQPSVISFNRAEEKKKTSRKPYHCPVQWSPPIYIGKSTI